LLQTLAHLIPARLLARIDTILHGHAARHFSQEGEDIVLQRIFEGRGPGHYVDVGAHHPRRFSNTCLFHLQGWTGMNIDPNPEAMQLFQSERPRDINLQVGVSNVPGTLTYFIFDEPALNTFDSPLAEKRVKETRFRIVDRKTVPVERLDALLSRHWPVDWAIDFMSIDAEGFDLKVIQSNTWEKYRPTYVLVECLGASLDAIDGHPVHALLIEKGYKVYAKTVNTFFYRDALNGPVR
jgi:FkbM family methyltransferase